MSKFSTVTRRLILGRPFRSDRLTNRLLPKRIALGVFASDTLSSIAYGPEQVLIVLAALTVGSHTLGLWIGLSIAVVFIIVVLSYQQTVYAYPSGGGDYEVVSKNLGSIAGMIVASALMVDYILTVGVSLSSAVANLGSVIPAISTHKIIYALIATGLVGAMNLRGIRESRILWAIPVYLFLASIYAMLGWGLVQIYILHRHLQASSASLEFSSPQISLSGYALLFVLARAFSSGCVALSGVETIVSGVPAFRQPKSRNASSTLLIMGIAGVTLLLGVLFLAQQTGVKLSSHPQRDFTLIPEGYIQQTLLIQLAQAIFWQSPYGSWIIAIATTLILVLAANSAFNSFPLLGSMLAQDQYLPRQLHTRGDRGAFSNGIIFLAVLAGIFIITFHANVSSLIQLYIIGVFLSFTLSQIAMVFYWNRVIPGERNMRTRARMNRSRIVNIIGSLATGIVFLIVVAAKFFSGAWIALVTIIAICALMQLIHQHYERVNQELNTCLHADDHQAILPSYSHAIVLVSKMHLPTLRALAYARATHPDTLEAITVNVDDLETRSLLKQWEDSDATIPLKVIASPYREITRPVLDYVRRITKESPRTVVTIYIPEYIVGRWWEHLLHNQSALRLKTRLLFLPGVMVTSVPWCLKSSKQRQSATPHLAPGDIRRGF